MLFKRTKPGASGEIGQIGVIFTVNNSFNVQNCTAMLILSYILPVMWLRLLPEPVKN
jgi:hypothetical protein